MALGSKKYNAQIWKTRLWIGLVLFFCGFLALSLYHRMTIQQDAIEKRKDIEAEKKLLEERYQEMITKKEYLQSDEGIEAEIRKNFDVAKEGETVIILVEDEQQTETPTTAPAAPVTVRVRPWWRFW